MSDVVLSKTMQGQLWQDYPLAKHTSWFIGGNAAYVYRPTSLDDCQQFYQWASNHLALPSLWLGLGSNVLLPDTGLHALVVLPKSGLNALTFDANIFRAEAGVTCAKLAKYAVSSGFDAAAFFAGIPGTVGGALAMNAGAFGHETWPYVKAVEVMAPDGTIQTHAASDFHWGYRFVHGLKTQHWFVAAHLQFPQIEEGLPIKAYLAKREATQPIGTKNCGSVFRNPPGDHAARLIQACGLKGKQIGQMVVSPKHANFIINLDGGTASQTLELMTFVQSQVQTEFGVTLQPEVKIVKELT